METILTKTEYKKDGKKWVEVTKEISEISKEQYENITSKDTLCFFRRLGGRETVKKEYTSKGYICTFLSSVSPDKQTKIVREFEFIN